MRIAPFALLLAAASALGCSLPRSPIVPRMDAGPMDAGRDTPDIDSPLDAPRMDTADVPEPVDAFDGGPDVPAPPDVPTDVPTDVPPDAPMLEGCDRYSVLSGYMNCPGPTVPSTQCRFFVDPASPRSCNELCAIVPGATCIGIYEVGMLMCGGIGGATAGGCARTFDPMVCLCTNVP